MTYLLLSNEDKYPQDFLVILKWSLQNYYLKICILITTCIVICSNLQPHTGVLSAAGLYRKHKQHFMQRKSFFLPNIPLLRFSFREESTSSWAIQLFINPLLIISVYSSDSIFHNQEVLLIGTTTMGTGIGTKKGKCSLI